MAKKQSPTSLRGVFPKNYQPASLRHNPEKYEEVAGRPPSPEFINFVGQSMRQLFEDTARLRGENAKLRRIPSDNGKKNVGLAKEREFAFEAAKRLRDADIDVPQSKIIAEILTLWPDLNLDTVTKWVRGWHRRGKIPKP